MSDETLGQALDRLWQTVEARKSADPTKSYTAQLLSEGVSKAAQKLGEEAVETVIAAVEGDKDGVASEAADLLYHLMVLLAASDVDPQTVAAKLEAREGTSGLEEKAKR